MSPYMLRVHGGSRKNLFCLTKDFFLGVVAAVGSIGGGVSNCEVKDLPTQSEPTLAFLVLWGKRKGAKCATLFP